MSYNNFIKAMELAPKCKFYYTSGGQTDENIKLSERILNIKFSKQCKEFYGQYGYLSFYGNEIFGINPKDTSGILEGNSLTYALNDREKYNLPQEWLPIYNYNDGNMAYLDYSKLNADNEPRVINAFNDGDKYVIIETVANDLGEFILQLVQNQLKKQ